ncbi:MAG: GNAT family N-acetyltransferase [Actinomycetota bacterium]|nr:GNAT family N-acetyltransferase [Actinomycetota bacterium]
MIELRTPTSDDYPAMGRQIHESFGASEPDELQREQVLIDFGRFRIAYDTAARRVVGVSGSWAMEMTLPGGAMVPMGGVTWVAVSPTYRRQGILTRMLDSLHADIAARGEPLAGLGASEAPIYGRFGYSVATHRRGATIDRRMVSFATELAAPAGSVALLPGDDPGLLELIRPRWDRYRRSRVGELDRSDDRHRYLIANRGPQAHFAFHEDGYASWKVTPDWSDAPPKHGLRITDFVASSPAAYEALWSTILSIDLVGPVMSWNMPLDDPLPYLISNPRAVRTTAIDDNVWLKVLDLPAVFGRRTYGVDDDVVIDVGGSRWTVGSGGCSRARRRADLVIDPNVVGALVLGGVSPFTLHAGRRLEARSPEALRRATLLFRTYPDPTCQTPI